MHEIEFSVKGPSQAVNNADIRSGVANGQSNTCSSTFRLNYINCSELNILSPGVDQALVRDVHNAVELFDRAVCLLAEAKVDIKYMPNTNFDVGIPEFAAEIVTAIKTDQAFKFYVVGDANTPADLESIFEHFQSDRALSPLHKYVFPGRHADCIYLNWRSGKEALREIVAKSPAINTCSYMNLEHYCAEQGTAYLLEMYGLKERQEAYEDLFHNVCFLNIAGQEGRGYYTMFINTPNEHQVRLNDGDVIHVCFDADTAHESVPWKGVVNAPLPDCPHNMTTVLLIRPWTQGYNAHGCFSDDRELTVLKNSELSAKGYETISKAPKTKVKLTIENTNKDFDRMMNTLKGLWRGETDVRAGNLYAQFIKVFVANQLSTLPITDVHSCLTAHDPNWFRSLDLHESQVAALEASTQNLGPIALFHGSPGTGKSHVAKQIVSAYMKYGDTGQQHQIMYIAPDNHCTTDGALRFAEALKELHKQGLCERATVVRVHSASTELRIGNIHAVKDKPRPIGARPSSGTPNTEEREFLNQITLARNIYDNFVKGQEDYKGVRDPRVRAVTLSLGYLVCQWVGIFRGGVKCEDQEKWSSLRTLFYDVKTGPLPWDHSEDLVEAQIKALSNQLNKARKEVLKHASVVCATVSNAASDYLIDSCADNTVHIIVDEAGKTSSLELLTVLLKPFNSLAGVTLLGDPLQGKKLAQIFDNTHKGLISLSTMSQLSQCGFPMQQFTTQFRMIEKIHSITNSLILNNRVHTSATVGHGHREMVIDEVIQQFNVEQFRTKEPVVCIDVRSTSKIQTTVGIGKSKFNKAYVAIIFNYIMKLLAKDSNLSICYLTAYKAQERLGLSALSTMRSRDITGHENVQVMTWDKSQGKEFDVVFYDILIEEDGKPGIQNNMDKLYVVHTRARHALYAVEDKNIIDRLRMQRHIGLRKFQSKMIASCLFPLRFARDEFPSCTLFSSHGQA